MSFSTWFRTQLTTFRNWWNDSGTQARITMALVHFINAVDEFFRNFGRLMVYGFILNIIVTIVYPDFPERFPIIYGFYDGWLQLGEFCLRTGINALYAFFTGTFEQFQTDYILAYNELIDGFKAWLESIKF